MKTNMCMRILPLVLLIALLLACCPAAFAEEGEAVLLPMKLKLTPESFQPGQYYEFSQDGTQICTVQMAAGCSLAGANALRDSLLAQGYDSFVYLKDGLYYVMCGKFGDLYDAMCYNEAIHADNDGSSAYVVNAWLPWGAVVSFEATFYKAVTIDKDSSVMETGWEQPTGAFFRASADDTVEVHTVQLCEGTSFARSEALRDKLNDAGFPAFVYKENMSYRVMSGMFYDRSEAKAYCRSILNVAGVPGVVKTALVPEEEADSFLAQWNG